MHTSVAYFCPLCGEIWAKCLMTSPSGIARPFESIHTACPQHPQMPWDGSFWLPWDQPYCNEFPPALLCWEIVQTAEHIRLGLFDRFFTGE